MTRGIALVSLVLMACGSADRATFGDDPSGPVSAAEHDAGNGAGGAVADDAAVAASGSATGGKPAAPRETDAGGDIDSGGSVATGSGGATTGNGGAAQGSGGLWCQAWGCGTGSAGSATGGRAAMGGTTGAGGSSGPPNGGVCDPAMCAGDPIPAGATHLCAYSLTGSGPWVPTCGYACPAAGCGTGGATGTGGGSGTGGDPTGRCIGAQGNVLAYVGACGTPSDPHKVAACRNWACVEFCAPGYTCP